MVEPTDMSHLADAAGRRTALQEDPDGRVGRLTARERDVLAMMSQGLSNDGISRTCHLSSKTVERHISQILMKLGLDVEVDGHRRVLAVLIHLRASAGAAGPVQDRSWAPVASVG